jgi:hypothetical protein
MPIAPPATIVIGPVAALDLLDPVAAAGRGAAVAYSASPTG